MIRVQSNRFNPTDRGVYAGLQANWSSRENWSAHGGYWMNRGLMGIIDQVCDLLFVVFDDLS